MLRRSPWLSASCWKPHDFLRGKSKPITKHTKSIFGKNGRIRRWSINHGLRDARPNGTEYIKGTGGIRAGGGLYGARVQQSQTKSKAAEVEMALFGVPNITNRYHGHPEDNPLLHQLLAPTPVSHRVAFFLNHHASGVHHALPRSIVIERVRQTLSQMESLSSLHGEVEHVSFVGSRAAVTLPSTSELLGSDEHLAMLMNYLGKRSREISGSAATDVQGYENAETLLHRYCEEAKLVKDAVQFDDCGILQMIDKQRTPATWVVVSQPLHGCGGPKASPAKETVKWWWKNNDPSRPVCNALQKRATTSHRVASFVCVPVMQLHADLASALHRRTVEEVQERPCDIIQAFDEYCARKSVVYHPEPLRFSSAAVSAA